MVITRKQLAARLALLGLLGILSIFAVDLGYYRTMPREPQQETGRVLTFRALRTTVYVNERERRIAATAAFLAPLGFVMAALGAYLSNTAGGGTPPRE